MLHSIRCIRCGVRFDSPRSHAQTCSDACRKALSRTRRRSALILDAAAFFATADGPDLDRASALLGDDEAV
ncbi:hypothetical protein [Agromyces sp. H66]|uniref:hypothetical protein n=1 Tax=Agromyces sp. H66 TaxID=2529859 RepID=UPI0010A9BAF6|nr:hypothetical protein [Agromyces sp. H66]